MLQQICQNKKVNEYESNNPEFVDWSKDINTFNKNQNMVRINNGNPINYVYNNTKIKQELHQLQGNVKIKNPLQKEAKTYFL